MKLSNQGLPFPFQLTRRKEEKTKFSVKKKENWISEGKAVKPGSNCYKDGQTQTLVLGENYTPITQ